MNAKNLQVIKNIRTKMTLVTPAMAAKWLDSNHTDQRRLRQSYIEKLAHDMTEDRWYLTHQGIGFNCDGALLDGQHRLNAIVQSNTAQWMLITRGLPKEAMTAVDDHSRRTVTDSFKIAYGKEYSSRVTSTASAMAGAGSPVGSPAQRSRQAQMAYITKHEKAILWALEAFPCKAKGIGRAAVPGVIARAYYSVEKSRLKRFCEVLSSGVTASSDEAKIIKLRDWLSRAGSAGHAANQTAYRKVARTLKAYVDGGFKNYTDDELFLLPDDEAGQ